MLYIYISLSYPDSLAVVTLKISARSPGPAPFLSDSFRLFPLILEILLYVDYNDEVIVGMNNCMHENHKILILVFGITCPFSFFFFYQIKSFKDFFLELKSPLRI